jgi:nitrous oxidase accessory protein
MKRKCLVVGIILLFIGTITIPSITSEQTCNKNIITVDNEPGDADFTSIKEAVNSSSPGDTIEVYSGTYTEQEIRIIKDNITLLGISHELGEGNDSGMPFIKGNGTGEVIWVEASHVIISNFTIENPLAENSTGFFCGIRVQKYYAPFEQHDVTISDCIIRNTLFGIYVYQPRQNMRITNNYISNCLEDGLASTAYGNLSMDFIITGNVITDCGDHDGDYGLDFTGDHHNVSGNRIRNCKYGGINFGGTNNFIYGNDIENCNIGIRCGGSGNIITKNNFKNYNRIGFWFYKYLLWPGKNRWIGNYWDTWIGIGPKTILGFKVFEWVSELIYFIFLIPWLEFDWQPAKEPYDITI